MVSGVGKRTAYQKSRTELGLETTAHYLIYERISLAEPSVELWDTHDSPGAGITRVTADFELTSRSEAIVQDNA